MTRRTILWSAAAALVSVALVAGGARAYRTIDGVRVRAARYQSRWEHLRGDPASVEHYRAANAGLQSIDPGGARTVFIGASITEAMDLARWFPDRHFENRGIGGQLTWQEYLRMPDDVVALHPESVAIEVCATNFEPSAPPPEQTQMWLARMADVARGNGIRPVLSTVIPVSHAYAADLAPWPIAARIESANQWIRGYASQHAYTLMDHAAALGDGHGYLADQFTDDGLHPNAAGYARMVSVIRTALPARVASR